MLILSKFIKLAFRDLLLQILTVMCLFNILSAKTMSVLRRIKECWSNLSLSNLSLHDAFIVQLVS